MKLYGVFFFLLIFITINTGNANAVTKKRKPDFRVVEATSQRIMPGIPGAPIKTEFVFTVVWMTNQKPLSFFWKDDTVWKNCTLSKATEMVRKGDTLTIATTRGKVQQRLPQAARNSLCYKTVSGWRLVQVKKVVQKTDAAAP